MALTFISLCSSTLANAQSRVEASTRAQCRYYEEQAAAEATLLQSPELVLQALRFPNAYGTDGTTWGTGFQGRVGLAYSPTDFIKGMEVKSLGAAQCRAERLETRALVGLGSGLEGARRAALEARLHYLEQEQATWQQVRQRTEARLSEQLITRGDAVDVRRRIQALESELLDTRAQLELLAARSTGTPTDPKATTLGSTVQQYVDARAEVEHAQSQLRRLSAWQLRVSGGVIPMPSEVSWYTFAELRLNLGAPQQARHLAQAEVAKQTALKQSPRELPAQLFRLREEARALSAQSERRLLLLDQQLASIDADVAALASAEHAAAGQLEDSLHLERIAAEAERSALRGLITGLGAFAREGANP